MKNRHITKDQLMATMAFLMNSPLSGAKDMYNKDKVDQIIKNIITTFNLMSGHMSPM